MKDLRGAISDLWTALSAIGRKHREFFDTDVREQLDETLSYYFVWGKPLHPLPTSYGMYTARGDAAVAKAVAAFLTLACPLATLHKLRRGQARFDLLQDADIRSVDGKVGYDTFFGRSAKPLPATPLAAYRFENASPEPE